MKPPIDYVSPENADDVRLADIDRRIDQLRRGESESPSMSPDMQQEDKYTVAEAFESEIDDGLSPEERAAHETDAHKAMEKLVLAGLGAHHQRAVEERVNARRPVEDRWLQDLRQYHSKYDPALEMKITEAKGSKAFVNITGPRTDGFAARMADMILPSTGKNWGMKNTPVPEVLGAMHDETPIIDGPTGKPFQTPDGNVVQNRDVAKGISDTLEDRRKDMEREMDDQLTECNYNAAQRRGIDQVAQIGTMVLKGPTIIGRSRKVWRKVQDATGVAHVCEIIEDKRPAVEYVDVWDFFPDMNSPDPEGWEDVYQRHYMTKRQLRALAKQPGFDEDAIRQVLKEERKPYATALHLQALRDITGEHQTTQLMERFELWEYHGPVTAEQLAACGCDVQTEDPLAVLDAVLWFCEGTVLKAAVNPVEGSGLGYHVTWVKKDETSPFGFGIPRLMRNSQKVANAAWRMVMDNAGLALAPQIIMAMGVVPADGKWNMYPGKIWIAKEGTVDVRAAMQTFNVPVQLKDLLMIFETAVKMADEETSMPVIMQGERGPAVPETAEGMAMLFSAASVIQRRFVRLFDDRITTPIITGLYDWNMQFNPKEEIKGDYSIVALGSSALLEKERFTQAAIQGLTLAASNPLIEPRVKLHGLIAEVYKSMNLGDYVRDEKEADAEVAKRQQAMAQAQAQGQGGQQQGGMLQLKQMEIEERAKKREQEAAIHRDRMQVELQKLSETTGISRDKLATQLGIAKLKEDSNNQRFNAEMAHANQAGQGI
jgi:hypothetical protein